MKERKRIAALALGLAVIAVTAVTGYANSEARRDTSGMTLVEHREYYDGDFFIVDDVYFDNRPHTDISDDDNENSEDVTEDSHENGECYFNGIAPEAPDFTEMTKIDHREYIENGLLVVDDVYYKGAEASVSAVGDDVWIEGYIAVNRSIYDNTDLNYEKLVATMTLRADFEWNGETAKVTREPYLDSNIESAVTEQGVEKKNKVVAIASDQGENFLFGNKYAYVEYVVTLSDYPGLSKDMDFRLYASINRYGERNVEN